MNLGTGVKLKLTCPNKSFLWNPRF